MDEANFEKKGEPPVSKGFTADHKTNDLSAKGNEVRPFFMQYDILDDNLTSPIPSASPQKELPLKTISNVTNFCRQWKLPAPHEMLMVSDGVVDEIAYDGKRCSRLQAPVATYEEMRLKIKAKYEIRSH